MNKILLKFLHWIGMTNLSDKQVSDFERKDDQQILDEYLLICQIDKQKMPQYLIDFFLRDIRRARELEPRINDGYHYYDLGNICDEDDNFDSFYGKDYFK